MKTNSLLLALVVLLLGVLVVVLANPSVVREYVPVSQSPDIVYVRDSPWWGGGLPWGLITKPFGGYPHHPPPASPPPPPSGGSPPPASPPPPAEAPPPPQPLGFLDMSELVKEGFASCPYKN